MIVGSVMILLSLGVQLFFYVFLSFPAYALLDAFHLPKEGPAIQWTIIGFYAAVFNGIACFEYFRRRRQATLGTTSLRKNIHAFKAVASPDSKHIAWALFLGPRGIDRIAFGRELMLQIVQSEAHGQPSAESNGGVGKWPA